MGLWVLKPGTVLGKPGQLVTLEIIPKLPCNWLPLYHFSLTASKPLKSVSVPITCPGPHLTISSLHTWVLEHLSLPDVSELS